MDNDAIAPMAQALENLAGALGDSAKFKLSPFKGGKDQSIESYIDKFNQFCETNGKDEQYKINNFKMYLDGRAYKLYESLPQATKNNWDLLADQLKQYFAPTQLPPVQAFEHFHSLKMKTKETVQEFFERIIEGTKNLEVPENQKLAVFVANMPKYIKDFLILQNPATIGAALVMAKQREIIGASAEENDTKKMLTDILGKLDIKDKKQECAAAEGAAATKPRPSEPCAYCGKENHTMSNCFQWINSQGGANNQNGLSEKQKMTCQMCGEDHPMKDCRFYKRHSQNVQGANNNFPSNGNRMDQRNNINRIGNNGGNTFVGNNATKNCYFCGRPGHIMQDCRTYNNNNNNRTTRCEFCFRQGHTIEECRSYSYANRPNIDPQNRQGGRNFQPNANANDPRNGTYFQNRPQNQPQNRSGGIDRNQQFRPNMSVTDTPSKMTFTTTQAGRKRRLSFSTPLVTSHYFDDNHKDEASSESEDEYVPTKKQIQEDETGEITKIKEVCSSEYRSPPTMRLNVKIGDKTFRALLDTGASVSGINITKTSELPTKPKWEQSPHPSITCVDGRNAEVYGMIF